MIVGLPLSGSETLGTDAAVFCFDFHCAFKKSLFPYIFIVRRFYNISCRRSFCKLQKNFSLLPTFPAATLRVLRYCVLLV